MATSAVSTLKTAGTCAQACDADSTCLGFTYVSSGTDLGKCSLYQAMGWGGSVATPATDDAFVGMQPSLPVAIYQAARPGQL